MVNRRKLFGLLAASPAIATSVVISKANENLEPENNILSLQAQRMRKSSGNQFTIQGFENYGPTLGISVGRDGNMWIKVNNKWKRVVSE